MFIGYLNMLFCEMMISFAHFKLDHFLSFFHQTFLSDLGHGQYSVLVLLDFVVVVHLLRSSPTFCNPMDCSIPGFPVLYHLLEFAQTHVH